MSAAGGLGLIGGGYGDAEWLRSQIGQLGGARVGFGFITWRLARDPGLLDVVVAQQPATIMLSFGELAPFAERIQAAGIPLTAQVQNLEHARRALDAGADVIVAQGGEAGGHGMTVRSTFTLVPDVVDLVAERSPETVVVAAGASAMVGAGRGARTRRRRGLGGHQILGVPGSVGVAARARTGHRGQRRRHASHPGV